MFKKYLNISLTLIWMYTCVWMLVSIHQQLHIVELTVILSVLLIAHFLHHIYSNTVHKADKMALESSTDALEHNILMIRDLMKIINARTTVIKVKEPKNDESN